LLVDKGSVLVVDNVCSHAAELAEFVSLVQSDDGFGSLTLPLGAGLLLVTRM
jgi:predicted O-methyltransferase YrrM